ncbi:MAG: hypothetical protein EOO69_02505 [Moraxellaceae bacterium]|nr:MAG: hypothetical protein EOO69_02505 [Moraxellaceae bacterium]
MTIKNLFRVAWSYISPTRKLEVIQGDSLPKKMPYRNLVLAQDDGEDWCIGMKCPCGCGYTIELLVISEAKPRWDIRIDDKGLPTLQPSVFLKGGCKSHFWVRNGRIKWCM